MDCAPSSPAERSPPPSASPCAEPQLVEQAGREVLRVLLARVRAGREAVERDRQFAAELRHLSFAVRAFRGGEPGQLVCTSSRLLPSGSRNQNIGGTGSPIRITSASTSILLARIAALLASIYIEYTRVQGHVRS